MPTHDPGPPSAGLLPPPLDDGVVRLRLPAETDLPDVVAPCSDPEGPHRTLVPSPYGQAVGWTAIVGDLLAEDLP